MEGIFVVLFLLSVGVNVGLWQRKQFWKEEYLNCLREELEDRQMQYEYELGVHLEEERMKEYDA